METKSRLLSPTFQGLSSSSKWNSSCSCISPNLTCFFFFFFNQLPSPFLSSLLFSLSGRVPACTLVLEPGPACTCFPSAWGRPFQQTAYYALTHMSTVNTTQTPALITLFPCHFSPLLDLLTSQLNICMMFCLRVCLPSLCLAIRTETTWGQGFLFAWLY